jgi:hypothetical protein
MPSVDCLVYFWLCALPNGRIFRRVEHGKDYQINEIDHAFGCVYVDAALASRISEKETRCGDGCAERGLCSRLQISRFSSRWSRHR